MTPQQQQHKSAQIELERAKAMIQDKAHWTTGALARDKEGLPVYSHIDKAVCWCAFGALTLGIPRYNLFAETLLDEAARKLGYKSLTVANDTGGHHVTMQMFDAAIAAAKWGASGLTVKPKPHPTPLIEALPFKGLT